MKLRNYFRSEIDKERYFNDPDYRLKILRMLKRRKQIKNIVIILLAVLLSAYIVYLAVGLPSLQQLENPTPELATKVYSYDGELLGQFYIKQRTYTPIDSIPKNLIKALIATEDRKFYKHWGIDLDRVLKAMVKNILSLRIREGASTITQQLARNLYLSQELSITRKIREAITAVQIERTYTKEEILEMYLNIAYFGMSAYGVESASFVYFGKSPSELTLAECALLVGMLRSPAKYNPFEYPDRAIRIRDVVLKNMLTVGFITEQEYKKAKMEPLNLNRGREYIYSGIAPHFLEYIRWQLQKKAEKYGFNIYRDGLVVYTTLDARMQRHAIRAVKEQLAELQQEFDKSWRWDKNLLKVILDKAIRQDLRYVNADSTEKPKIYAQLLNDNAFVDSVKREATRIQVGFVAIEPQTGYIKAMVGSSNFEVFKYGLNHVTQIKRQPGSAFKPFVYTVAIDNGYSPAYQLLNQPITIIMANGERWTPSNFDGTFGGKVTLREALKMSINVVAVRVLQELAPINQVIDYAHKMGITTDIPPYESIALGTAEVIPLQLTSAYGVFANDGIYVEPVAILRIEDRFGNVIEEAKPEKRVVISPETAYIITDILEDAVNSGTGTRVRQFFHLPCAGKTGTTQEFADAWFIGYTPNLVAGVWLGFDDRRITFGGTFGQGGRAAAPMWGRFMKYVYDDPDINMPILDFEQPPDVVTATVCAESQKLATPYCPQKITDLFIRKYLPTKECDIHTSEQKPRIMF
ncbi:penicillin-binding protein 1A [Candidatus Thermokryptus mobilis]|uniref:peptidoglycan glycosyltransferase n=1 Tax=Candidatus Thermokryptus mobilis TaxID=1643428 RepID=A0A0S4MRJ6_9BACT|nr:PBP1A family penicillin-binding protein [Candidatus Thermokryptus mobilis]CUU01708.1 penicillin-binding protein 1A [Candidatus Thermokryptus mobilis]